MWWESNPQTWWYHTWAIKTSEPHKKDECVQCYINNTNSTSNFLRWLQFNCLSHSHYVTMSWHTTFTVKKKREGPWVNDSTEVEFFNCSQPGPLYLETVGVDDLVADGALHQHEVELVLLFLQCVLLPCLFTHHAHRRVGQNRLHGSRTKHQEHAGINTTQQSMLSWQLLKAAAEKYKFQRKGNLPQCTVS